MISLLVVNYRSAQLAIEAAWPQQRRVEHIGAVGRGQHDHRLT